MSGHHRNQSRISCASTQRKSSDARSKSKSHHISLLLGNHHRKPLLLWRNFVSGIGKSNANTNKNKMNCIYSEGIAVSTFGGVLCSMRIGLVGLRHLILCPPPSHTLVWGARQLARTEPMLMCWIRHWKCPQGRPRSGSRRAKQTDGRQCTLPRQRHTEQLLEQ